MTTKVRVEAGSYRDEVVVGPRGWKGLVREMIGCALDLQGRAEVQVVYEDEVQVLESKKEISDFIKAVEPPKARRWRW